MEEKVYNNPYTIKLLGTQYEQTLVAIQKATPRDLILFFNGDIPLIDKLPKSYFKDWRDYTNIESYYEMNMNERDYEKLKSFIIENKLNSKLFVKQAWGLVKDTSEDGESKS